MKKPFYMSIKTKLFLIMSALMALILIVQFFLTYQVQRDMLSELNHLSKNFNKAIDSHYAQVLEDIQNMEELEFRTQQLVSDSLKYLDTYTIHPESLYFQVISELKQVREAEKVLQESFIHSPYSQEYDVKFESELPHEFEKMMESFGIPKKQQQK